MPLFIRRNSCLLLLTLLVSSVSFSQNIANAVVLEQGKTYKITIHSEDTITQQAGGRAIDFITKGIAEHSYTVEALVNTGYRLQHQMNRIAYQFDGMNQKENFDSDKDDGAYKELLKAKYAMVISPTGAIIKTEPSSIPELKPSENLLIVNEMLQNAIRAAYPPEGNSKSLFQILPDRAVNTGDKWSDTMARKGERSVTEYTLKQITDTDIVIDFSMLTTAENISQVMGRDSKTNLKVNTTGTIILDKNTRVLKEQKSRSLSSGTKEIMGATLPLTGKNTMTIQLSVQ